MLATPRGAASCTWTGWILTRSPAEGSSENSVSLLRDRTGRGIDHDGGGCFEQVQRRLQSMEGIATFLSLATDEKGSVGLFFATVVAT